MTDSSVEAVARAIQTHLAEHTGFSTDDGEGIVSAYYGGNWIQLDTNKIAEAAIAALPAPEREPLREALEAAREAIASLAEDTFGEVILEYDDNGYPVCGYPVRDELLTKIDAALAPPTAQSGDRT